MFYFLKVFLFLIIPFLYSCNVTKRYYVRGEYDRAIVRAVKKIKKNPSNEKEIYYLEKAYNTANLQDNEKLKLLKQEGRPENWATILQLYQQLKYRQSIVQPILPIYIKGREINFPYIDYDKDIIYAKENAAEYWYSKGKQLLTTGNRFDARQAYEFFKNVKYYFDTYQDVDKYIQIAQESGCTKIILQLQNKTIYKLDNEFTSFLFNLPFENLEKKWTKYYTVPNDNVQYHYAIQLKINQILISPEKMFVRESIKTKKVQDGTEILLDANNNVVKDSTGNPVRVPRYVDVSCKLIENVQQKSSRIEAEVTFFDIEQQKNITTKPIVSEFFFEHISYIANGDLRALDKEILDQLGRLPIPFPSDMEMIQGNSQILKNLFFDVIKDYSYLFK